MKKPKIFILIPLLIIAGYLIYSWITIWFTEIGATWRQYLALMLFVVPCVLFFRDFKKTIIITMVYLLLGTANVLSILPISSLYSFTINLFVPITCPYFQPSSLGLAILTFVLNFDTLANLYLDYKEAKEKKKLSQ